MKNLGDYLRIMLTFALLALTYQETGWATTAALVLIVGRAEVLDFNTKRTWKA